MLTVTQTPGTSIVPRMTGKPLTERRYSPEWPDTLSRLWWIATNAHAAYVELLELADTLGASAPAELLALLRTASEHWHAIERYALPTWRQWQVSQARPDIR